MWISSESWEDLSESLSTIQTDTLIVLWDISAYELYKSKIKYPPNIVHHIPVGKGEQAKSFTNYEDICEKILTLNFHRNGHILAIGGGAVLDLAGFIAATILRGVAWSSIPTTLLAMVDAAIGGKTAINCKAGKNLIGAFHLPQHIFFFDKFLSSLPKQEKISGKGEIVKYAFLNEKINSAIISGASLQEIIMLCAHYKQAIVDEDLFESGKRKILNFGHTFGHAFEKKYGIPHGEAVLHGINYILKLFSQDTEPLNNLCQYLQIDLKFDLTLDLNDVTKWVFKDKKRSSFRELDLIVVEDIGSPKIISVSEEDILTRCLNVSDSNCSRFSSSSNLGSN